MTNTHPVDSLAEKIGADWKHISAARKTTETTLENIRRALDTPTDDGVPLLSREEVSIVAFGSLARQEFTQGSDLDWTLLVDGQADPAHLEHKREVEHLLERSGLREPGQEGTFGEMVFSHDLVHQIV